MSDDRARGMMGIDLGCLVGLAVTPRSDWTCDGVLNSNGKPASDRTAAMALTRLESIKQLICSGTIIIMTRGKAPCKGPSTIYSGQYSSQEARILSHAQFPLQGGAWLGSCCRVKSWAEVAHGSSSRFDHLFSSSKLGQTSRCTRKRPGTPPTSG